MQKLGRSLLKYRKRTISDLTILEESAVALDLLKTETTNLDAGEFIDGLHDRRHIGNRAVMYMAFSFSPETKRVPIIAAWQSDHSTAAKTMIVEAGEDTRIDIAPAPMPIDHLRGRAAALRVFDIFT